MLKNNFYKKIKFKNALHNLPITKLIEKTIEKKQGRLSESGALAINTACSQEDLQKIDFL